VGYITVSGADVYHEVTGDGPPLVLLHGGYCSIETLRPQIEELSRVYRVYAPERPGHGRTADREGPITFDGIVGDVVEYLDAVGLADAHLLGFSDGGIAGLLMALDHPARVRSLVAVGANLDPSGLVEGDDAVDKSGAEGHHPTDPLVRELEEQMQVDYDRLSPDGPAHADVVRQKLARLWREEPCIPAERLRSVMAPTLVMAGDHDSIATEHTVTIARGIPHAQLCIVPGATHLVMMERPELVNRIVREFLAGAADRAPFSAARA
jgi:pimeloyl-ACP methyl ester carboxylesterase